jgi:UDPglucose 6-dehydrogenase
MMHGPMTITIVGSGYVGLVTGAVFADLGHKVFCVDIDTDKISKLQEGQIPFYEPNLSELVKKGLEDSLLIFTTSFEDSIPQSEIVFICVGTPPGKNGEADISYLLSATKSVAGNLQNYTLIAIKSTVPIGVEKKLEEIFKKETESEYEFASTPEFLREGSALSDSKNPDRIVIGTNSERAGKILLDLYKDFGGEKLVCDLTSAQMIKYAANTYLATKISFANSIAEIAERLNADAEVVLRGTGLDKRIGSAFLKPGVGYGGSCFPKDVSAFIQIADSVGFDFSLLKETAKINENQITLFIEKLEKLLKNLKDKKIGILGLSFKPETDDIREAPSLKIIKKLLEKGSEIKVFDPIANQNVKNIFGSKIIFCSDPYQAITDTDALLLITDWDEFMNLDFKRIKDLMKKPVIFDGRSCLNQKELINLGFTYYGIGKGIKS